MARSAVNNRIVGQVLSIMDEDGPEVDKDEENDIGQLLQREDEREHVIRDRLSKAIQRMESMTSIGRRHNPLVVRLVKVLVDQRVVEVAMNPVDTKVGKKEEEWELQEVVPQSRSFFGRIVELAVTSHLNKEQGSRAQRHERHGLVGLEYLKPDLILDEFRVVQSSAVEDQIVRERGEDEVYQDTKDPGDEVESNDLSDGIIAC